MANATHVSSHDGNTVEYPHASKSGDIGIVVGKRTMQADDNPVELIFSQVGGARRAVGR